MNRDLKILIASFGLGALVMRIVHISSQFLSNPVSDRLTSVGIPKVVELDPNSQDKNLAKKVLMNDASIQKNWGLAGTHGESDIEANKAWTITQGDRQVIVAVIDTGADIHH